MATRRIQRELADLSNTPSDQFTAGPASDNDLLIWEAKLTGPATSAYAGGVFSVNLTFSSDYPSNHQRHVKFNTKIYHPNVDEDGSICIGVLKPDVWKPSNKIVDILHSLILILEEPNADDAINTSVAEVMNNPAGGKEKFEKTVKEWIKKYC
ncbi:ubiquitin-conjugating enzyme [Rhizoclosmatium globosum]|uniref:Ubiquitin-conjugating enzyme n=1 Tax=Rhizoclosmatium globosum TaxID=329046 RepID=A0A1Y2BXE5_9FUNG|nr:ubiquitin-conjugating enzyme [Rhizoclosmatium globosum]|eukprot:ORY39416.1 ubiquitin-conjugating enzyme [Rhizoclosmatium globosum]